jgi:hypothetical protein
MKQRKTKQNYPRFEFKPRQVNDSSQLNQGTDHLVSQSPSRTPPLTPGPVAARPHLSATPHRIARAPPPSPIRQPASTASACCRLRPRRPEPFQCRGPAADPAVHPPFSLHRVACPSRPLPHFPSLLLPVCPPIWRRRRCLTSLGSASTSELELPSFSTAYAPASPAPTTGDPSSSLVPARAPPSSAIIGEHNCALSLHPNGLTPHLLPPSLTLQGYTIDVIRHRSYLTAIEHRCPKHPPPPPHRAAARVSSTPDRPARHPPYGPHELTDRTLPSANHHRAVGKRATAPSRVRAPCLSLGRFSTGPSRQAEARPAFQPATHSRPLNPVGCSPRPDQARHCAQI